MGHTGQTKQWRTHSFGNKKTIALNKQTNKQTTAATVTKATALATAMANSKASTANGGGRLQDRQANRAASPIHWRLTHFHSIPNSQQVQTQSGPYFSLNAPSLHLC
jgi:hypothetical protein